MSRVDNLTVAPGSPDVMKAVLKSGRNKENNVIVPSSALTIREIQEKIPVKYFERNTTRSVMFLLRDLAQVALTYAIMYAVALPLATSMEVSAARTVADGGALSLMAGTAMTTAAWLLKGVLWAVFWFVQGLNGTALWVLAHECGHQAFSPMKGLNDAVGMILHSALLVPYHSWRITHGGHHKHTNHLTKDLVFVPEKRNSVVELVEDAPLVSLIQILLVFLFGWPAHLLFNASGQEFGRLACHFDPGAPFFRSEDRHDVVLSNFGIVSALFVIFSSVYRFGFTNVFYWYIVPYLWVNFWLVYITYLQHTDIRIPHYTHEHWTFVRGALAAVDRDYGFVLNTWFHHINDSHVVHHLFSKIPHYNAIQVTRKYIREILGATYITDERSLWKMLWEQRRECRYVVPAEGVCVFHG
ncbi:fatty acid desaturase, putative [Trypanosoma cruzi]|uniref:Fatty acid desaturase n=2 Tax=Trypanosoma cruzi TaxID=5693 RepID=V5BA48_TRYCR|nr:fatty acid desaturase, putative [Trypanosoma cruzi]ESS62917.1 fatty acid desaturase [Trypanosoma cruzi Dm28c]PBJ71573.1 fatty acid desaturase [Trypanosoma cruzi cruzi]PWU92997.1 cytochrome b5-dependent oleate desaturase [Trypanosoma cruzi]RNF14543.1 oleate desaturase [Trypanosoma cruzi]